MMTYVGLRVRKTVTTTSAAETEYTWQGAQVMHAKTPQGRLHFYYDGSRPSHVDFNGTMYTYVYSLQGDVLGLRDASGTLVVQYRYDAWGKQISKSGTLASTLGTANPFRYRGYIYDEETQLYYLQTRYYSPNRCRFISPDSPLGKAGGLLQHNLFCYCGNDPVNRADDGGKFWHFVVGAVIGGIIGAVSALANGGDAIDVAIGFVAGAGGGILAASGAGVVAQVIGSTAIAMSSNAAQQANHLFIAKDQKTFDTMDMFIDGAIGLVCGVLGGKGASYGNSKGIMAAGRQLYRRGIFNPKARSYYVKVAHRMGKEFVLEPLLLSMRNNVIVNVCGIVIKSRNCE